LLFFFGIFLPAITLLVEAVNHMCAESFFDPLPTVGHVFAIAAVPLANGAALWTLRRGGGARVEAMIFAQAIAVAIAGVYTVMFLPITAMAIEALAFAGLGLLPLSPLLSLIASARALAALRRLHPALTRPARRVVLGGLAAGIGLLIALNVPAALTQNLHGAGGVGRSRGEHLGDPVAAPHRPARPHDESHLPARKILRPAERAVRRADAAPAGPGARDLLSRHRPADRRRPGPARRALAVARAPAVTAGCRDHRVAQPSVPIVDRQPTHIDPPFPVTMTAPEKRVALDNTVEVETPEHVHFRYRVADRCAACAPTCWTCSSGASSCWSCRSSCWSR
jgi:hypothetical protein